jgi:transcription termination/antitermination protein NusA
MSQVMIQTSTPLESVPDLDAGIIEKLVAAGITTVEQVADMTPEQLEEIPGVGPKTVEKISIAVNNYFVTLDAPVEVEGESVAEEVVADETSAGEEVIAAEESEAVEQVEPSEVPLADGEVSEDEFSPEVQAGDTTGLSAEAEASSESVEELVEEGQYYEAEVVDGVENAAEPDVAEVTTHERPAVEGESVPDEELPGETR